MVSSNQPRVKQTRLQFCHEKELESSLRLYLSRLNFQRFEYCEADLNWSRILSGGAIIFVVILSAYFGAVAAAPIPNAVGQPLAIYELDSGPSGRFDDERVRGWTNDLGERSEWNLSTIHSYHDELIRVHGL